MNFREYFLNLSFPLAILVFFNKIFLQDLNVKERKKERKREREKEKSREKGKRDKVRY